MNDPTNAARSGTRRLFVVGLIVAAMLGAAFAGRYALLTYASKPQDPTPTPRKGLDAPFIVTPDPVVAEMVKLVQLTGDDLVYDLGCGDGRIVIAASAASGCRGKGFDIDPKLVELAERNAKAQGVDERVKFVEQDVFTVDLSEADVCMMYLLPWMMNKLLPQFQEMRPGSRIVAHDFWIDGVVPDKIVDVEKPPGPGGEKDSARLYLYVAPLRLDPTMEKGKPPRIENVVSVSADE